MFGRANPILSMADVAEIMRKRGFDAEFQQSTGEGKIGRIATSLRGVNFFVNFLGSSERYGSVGFFTVTENSDGRSLDEINRFNSTLRGTKLVLEGNTALPMTLS